MDYITITSDDVYFKHCYTFLKSLSRHSKNINVLLRCVNMADRQINSLEDIYENLEVINDQIKLSKVKNRLKGDMSWQWVGLENIKGSSYTYSDHMCYTNNMRFDNICSLLSRDNVSRVVNMDVDQIFVNDFSFDELFTSDADVYTFNEHDQKIKNIKDISDRVWIPDVWLIEGYKTDEPLIDESLIAVNKNRKTIDYFSQAKELIHNDFYNWDADFKIINQLYKTTDIKITTPKLKFIDRWYYNDDSVVWNGAGNNRITNNKYRALYNGYIKDCDSV